MNKQNFATFIATILKKSDYYYYYYYYYCKGKRKAFPLQIWSGPKGSRKLKFPDFMTKAQGCGKFVNLTHWPHLPTGNSPGTHFC